MPDGGCWLATTECSARRAFAFVTDSRSRHGRCDHSMDCAASCWARSCLLRCSLGGLRSRQCPWPCGTCGLRHSCSHHCRSRCCREDHSGPATGFVARFATSPFRWEWSSRSTRCSSYAASPTDSPTPCAHSITPHRSVSQSSRSGCSRARWTRCGSSHADVTTDALFDSLPPAPVGWTNSASTSPTSRCSAPVSYRTALSLSDPATASRSRFRVHRASHRSTCSVWSATRALISLNPFE